MVDKTEVELRCIQLIDGIVFLSSTVFKHSMTVLSTLSLSHLVAASLMHSYYSSKRSKKLRIKSLDESVCNCLFCGYVNNSNFFRIDLFSDLVMSYLNVFSLLIKLKIGSKHNSFLVISFKLTR